MGNFASQSLVVPALNHAHFKISHLFSIIIQFKNKFSFLTKFFLVACQVVFRGKLAWKNHQQRVSPTLGRGGLLQTCQWVEIQVEIQESWSRWKEIDVLITRPSVDFSSIAKHTTRFCSPSQWRAFDNQPFFLTSFFFLFVAEDRDRSRACRLEDAGSQSGKRARETLSLSLFEDVDTQPRVPFAKRYKYELH